MSGLRLAAVVLLMWPPGDTWAQSSAPINTDRPSFTNTPRVVGERTVQVETGVAFSRDTVERPFVGDVTLTTITAPNAMVRLGLNRRLELRFETPGWVHVENDAPFGEGSSGMADVNVALEYQFASQDGLGTDLAVIAGTSVPTSSGIATGRVDPFARLVWSRSLGAWASLGGTLNWSAPSSFERGRIRTLEASLVLAHGLGGPWSAFWEAVTRHRDLPIDGGSWIGNAGVLRRIGDEAQLDVWFGRGLNEAAPDWTVGAGLALRLHR